jgi:hypothetical protein
MQLSENNSYDLNIKSFAFLNNAVFQRNKCDIHVNYIRDWSLQRNVFDDLHTLILPAMFFTEVIRLQSRQVQRTNQR